MLSDHFVPVLTHSFEQVVAAVFSESTLEFTSTPVCYECGKNFE